MKNYKFTIAYDGSSYHGYQRQSGHITVQEVLERALRKLFKQPISINGSGRTDAGVHALGQVVNFKASTYVPLEKLKFAINNLLSADLRVINTEECALDFHARYSARSKHYKYKVLRTDMPTPFGCRYCWQIRSPLDLGLMQEATSLIVGEHDFTSFRSTGSIQGSAVRNIYAATWNIKPFEGGLSGWDASETCRVYEFDIHGNGFLYHMVRNLVGTIAQVGMGRMSLIEFEKLFLNKKRISKCAIAPAQGLYLYKVQY